MKGLLFILCFVYCVYILLLRRVVLLWKHKHINPIILPSNIANIEDLKKYLLDNHFQYPELIQIDESKIDNELLLITKSCTHILTLEDNLLYLNKSNYFKGFDLKEEKSCGESFVIHEYLKKLFKNSNIDTYKKYKHFKNITKYKLITLLIIIIFITSTLFLESDFYKSKGISSSYLDYNDSLTIGKAFKEYFSGSYDWESFEADGETYVNCTGWYYNTDKESVDTLVQFRILDDDKNFEVYTIELNEEPLSTLEMGFFLTNVFGSGSNNTTLNENINSNSDSMPADSKNDGDKNNPEDIINELYNSHLQEYSDTATLGEVLDYFYKDTEWSTYNDGDDILIKFDAKFQDEYTGNDMDVTYTFKPDENKNYNIDDVVYDGYSLPQSDISTMLWNIYYEHSIQDSSINNTSSNEYSTNSNLILNSSTSYDDLINNPDNPFDGIIIAYDTPTEGSELSVGVRDSYLAFYSTDKTIGEAFEDYFDDEEWFIDEETENSCIVVFKGSYTTKVTETFYTFGAAFTVDLTNNTFSLDAMINDDDILGPLDMSVMLNLIYGR